jgi:hypothetical protein
MWAIVSSPLVLSFDVTDKAAVDRVWPILSNTEVIAVNQHYSGSPGMLLLTDRAVYPSPLNTNGYYEYPGQLGQSRGWKDVCGMTACNGTCRTCTACTDPWGYATCPHYMTLHSASMTLDAADKWCSSNSSCQGFTYLTNSTGASASKPTTCYFRDATQIFFMDSEIGAITGKLGQSQWTSHVAKARAPPLSGAPKPSDPALDGATTSGLQVWIKDIGKKGTALLLVNTGNVKIDAYELDLALLPPLPGRNIKSARNLYTHEPYKFAAAEGKPLKFAGVAPHDSVMLLLQ